MLNWTLLRPANMAIIGAIVLMVMFLFAAAKTRMDKASATPAPSNPAPTTY